VSAGYCVYALDSRGHGETGANNPPIKEFHYADMADDVYKQQYAVYCKTE
jgi:alpha-beta hydrolase superfamily lysophospholipase